MVAQFRQIRHRAWFRCWDELPEPRRSLRAAGIVLGAALAMVAAVFLIRSLAAAFPGT